MPTVIHRYCLHHPRIHHGDESIFFQIAPWVVYDAQPVPALTQEIAAALRAGRVEAALHYSRRSAEIFCAAVAQADLDEAAKRLRHVAISQDCAEGLAALNAMSIS